MSTPAPPKAPPPPQKTATILLVYSLPHFPLYVCVLKMPELLNILSRAYETKNRHEIEKLYNLLISDLINDLAKCRAATIVKCNFATYTGNLIFEEKMTN